MTSRFLIAYVLIALLVLGMVFAFWRGVYNSKHNVHRRKRRERRARRAREEQGLLDGDIPPGGDS